MIDEELTDAVTARLDEEDAPVDRGTVPLEPLKAAVPVRLPAGKEYEYGFGV